MRQEKCRLRVREQLVATRLDRIDEGIQAPPWFPDRGVPMVELLAALLGAALDHRGAKIVLGLEYIADVSEGYAGGSGDFGQRCRSEPRW